MFESALSQYRVGLLRFESGRVLVFHGGVFECSSRMNGKPSSPVLRGLGASDGARLLDPWDYFPLARYSGAVPRSTDDRLRTSSFQRVAGYTSISLINRIRGSNCRVWRLSDTVRELSSTAVLNAHQWNPCRPSIIWKVVWTI